MRRELEPVLSAVQALPREELPSWIGGLAKIQAIALARLTEPVVVENSPDRELLDVLDVEAAASYIGMSPKWVYRRYKVLPHIRVGFGKRPRLKFRRQDLEAWLQEHRITTK